MSLRAAVIDTPFGPLSVVADSGTAVAAAFGAEIARLDRHLGRTDRYQVVADLGEISERLDAYLRGEVTAIDAIPVRARGSDVMQRLWARLRAVPAGATVSYAELGGDPRFARVAATACARNPVCVIVPCHRVIRSDGTLGGFGGGLATKRWLLDHEARWSGSGAPARELAAAL